MTRDDLIKRALGHREDVTITIGDVKICLEEELNKDPSEIDSDLINFCVDFLKNTKAD